MKGGDRKGTEERGEEGRGRKTPMNVG